MIKQWIYECTLFLFGQTHFTHSIATLRHNQSVRVFSKNHLAGAQPLEGGSL